MTDAVIAQKSPYEIELKRYASMWMENLLLFVNFMCVVYQILIL